MSTIQAQLIGGVLDAGTLRERLGVSPPTMMRLLRAEGQTVVRIGRTRATRYGLRRLWPTLTDTRFPLFRIDRAGNAHTVGELLTLAARQSAWLPDGLVSDGLPPHVADARPSGFLGRHFAAEHPDLALPPRLSDWSDHHILLALARRGEDWPGNLVVGDESFDRWQRLTTPSVAREDYARLANETIAGHPPGSSAGGERPKFGALLGDRHVLVKFAARGKRRDEAARRWCDLLVLEALALQVIASRGLDAATTTLIADSAHVFLESRRFDRVGPRGRLDVSSLASVHDNPADSWARAATALRDARRISEGDLRTLQWLDAFGALIGNVDRHHHNIVFFSDGDLLRLAPAFDQLPMLYAPLADSQLPTREFRVPTATADTLDVWPDARDAADEFWRTASRDERLSASMRKVCAANATRLAQGRQ